LKHVVEQMKYGKNYARSELLEMIKSVPYVFREKEPEGLLFIFQ